MIVTAAMVRAVLVRAMGAIVSARPWLPKDTWFCEPQESVSDDTIHWAVAHGTGAALQVERCVLSGRALWTATRVGGEAVLDLILDETKAALDRLSPRPASFLYGTPREVTYRFRIGTRSNLRRAA